MHPRVAVFVKNCLLAVCVFAPSVSSVVTVEEVVQHQAWFDIPESLELRSLVLWDVSAFKFKGSMVSSSSLSDVHPDRCQCFGFFLIRFYVFCAGVDSSNATWFVSIKSFRNVVFSLMTPIRILLSW